MTAIDKMAKEQKAERREAFENMIFSRLEGQWSDLEWQAVIGRIPENEANENIRYCFTYFLAEQALADGVSKEEFLAEMAETWDEVVKNEEAETLVDETTSDEEHADFPTAAWKTAVMAGETHLGYGAWIEQKLDEMEAKGHVDNDSDEVTHE